MNVGQYRALLGDLELKKAELMDVHDKYAYGYAKVVLATARNSVQEELNSLLSIELMPVPVVVSISSLVTTLAKIIGDTAQLAISAVYADGSSRDVTAGFKSIATFRDVDNGYNNTGFITGVDVSGFSTPETIKFTVVKTASGWHVDSTSMMGLGVELIENNDYGIVDIDGNLLGITFTTNGNEVKGDNWLIEVEGRASGTEYESSDPAVAAVNANGLIVAVGEGTADITITNNGSTVVIPITVTVA